MDLVVLLPISSAFRLHSLPRSKIVENLAVVNYDTNNLYLAPYDWRLSFYNLEERDGYFSKLKSVIEGLKYVDMTSLISGSYESWAVGSAKRRRPLSLLTRWAPLLVFLPWVTLSTVNARCPDSVGMISYFLILPRT